MSRNISELREQFMASRSPLRFDVPRSPRTRVHAWLEALGRKLVQWGQWLQWKATRTGPALRLPNVRADIDHERAN